MNLDEEYDETLNELIRWLSPVPWMLKKEEEMSSIGKIRLSLDPSIVYDYQKVIHLAACPSCESLLSWSLTKPVDGDKFCIAECCGMRYGMVAETIRVIGVPISSGNDLPKELADEDFLAELRQFERKNR